MEAFRKGARVWATLCSLGLVLVLLAACAPVAVGPPAEAPKPAVQKTEAPKRGGILQWAPIKPGQTLHPHRGGSSDIMRHAAGGYETLVSYKYEPAKDYKETFEIIPWLAESWQQPDDLTYIFTIRKGVKWHDGVAFTAEDVAFTYRWLLQEKFPASGRLAQADTIEAIDPYTLKITLKKPTPDFLMELADKNNLIVAKHVVERGDDLDKVLIGTGAIKMKSFRSGVETVWERNNDYWQPGRPYIDGVRQIWGLDASAQMAAFVTGEIDIWVTIDMTQLETVLKARPQTGFYTKPGENGFGVLLKLDRPPFNDVRVRRALHLAIDRDAMNQTLTKGKGVFVTPGVWPRRQGFAIPQEELRKLPGYRTPKDQDIAEAKRLLAEAGYPQGFSFDIIYNAGGEGPPRIAEMIPSQLKAIGVTANLKPLESGVYNKSDLTTGDWEGGNLPSLIQADFRNLYERFHSKGAANWIGLKDPKLDALIEGTLTGKDEDARKRAARQLQEYFLEQAYYIPTIELTNAALWQPWVVPGIHHSGSSGLQIAEDVYPQVWLDVEAMPASRR